MNEVAGKNITLPPLPQKTWRRNTEIAFVNERKELLNEYMQAIIKIPELTNSPALLTFLGLIEDQTQVRADRERLHIDSFIKKAQTGDIVLFRTAGFLSGALRGVTNCEFDHVAVVVKCMHDPKRPKVNLLEATTDGVVRYDCWTRLSQWNMVNAKICARQLSCERTKQMQQDAEKFMNEVDGLDYSLNLTKLLRKTSNADEQTQNPESSPEITGSEEKKDSTYFCSELIATLYKMWGILDPTISASQYWPSSFGSAGNLGLRNAELSTEMDIYFVKPAIERARITTND